LTKTVRKDYKIIKTRKIKRTIFYDKYEYEDINLSKQDSFKIGTCIFIYKLETRQHAYDIFCKPFIFLTQIKELENQEIRKSVKLLQNIYTINDVEFEDFIEVLYLKAQVDVISIG